MSQKVETLLTALPQLGSEPHGYYDIFTKQVPLQSRKAQTLALSGRLVQHH